MKKIKFLILIMLTFTLASCGIFNKVSKESEKKKESTEVKVNTDEKTKTEDKSKIVVSEKADTTITTKPKNIEVNTPINDLKDIKDLTIFKDNLISIKQNYDSLSKTLQTKLDILPDSLRIKINRLTRIDKDVIINNEISKDSTVKSEIKEKSTTKHKEPKNVFWYVILVIGVVGVGYFIFRRVIK